MSTHHADDLVESNARPWSSPSLPTTTTRLVIVPLPRGRTRTSHSDMLQVPNDVAAGVSSPSPSSSSRPRTPSSDSQVPTTACKYGTRIVNRLGLNRRWSLDSLCADQNKPTSTNQGEASVMRRVGGWRNDLVAEKTEGGRTRTAPRLSLSPLSKSYSTSTSSEQPRRAGSSSADAEMTTIESDPSAPSSVTVSTSPSLVSRHRPFMSPRWSRHPVPGEWPLDHEGRVLRRRPRTQNDLHVESPGSSMVRRVAGLDKRDSTSSGPTSEYEDGVMQGGLPREAIPKDILLLLALWGVMMSIVSLVLTTFATKQVDRPSIHARRSPSYRSSTHDKSSSSSVAPRSSPHPIQIDTAVTSAEQPPLPSRHVSFPSTTAPPTAAVDVKRSLSMTNEPVSAFGLLVTEPTPIERPVVQVPTSSVAGDASESSYSPHSTQGGASQPMPDLIADDGSNTASVRSSSPSPTEDRKRLSFPGFLSFNNVVGPSGHPPRKQRMSSGTVSPRTMSLVAHSHSPPTSRKSSIIATVHDSPHHIGDYHLSSIASVLSTPRGSHEGGRPEEAGRESPELEGKCPSSASSLKGKLAAAFNKKGNSKVGGSSAPVSTDIGHPTISPSRSPVTSPAMSRVASHTSADGSAAATGPRATRRRSSSVFSLFKRTKSDPLGPPPEKRLPSPPPNGLQSLKLRAKSPTIDEPVTTLLRKDPSGVTIPLEISGPLFPAHLPRPSAETARDAPEYPRQRAESAPEAQSNLPSRQSSTVADRPALRPSKSNNDAERTPTRDRGHGKPDSKRSGRSNPYEGVPDWSQHIPGYERRRRRAEIRELKRKLGIAQRWLDEESKLMPHDKQYKKDFIRWSREEARLMGTLKDLRDRGMEGKELKEFDMGEQSDAK